MEIYVFEDTCSGEENVKLAEFGELLENNVSLDKENAWSADYRYTVYYVSEFRETCTKQQDIVGERRRGVGKAVECLRSFVFKAVMIMFFCI